MVNVKKVNLGCGGNILDGFENRDADVDISKPLPWDDNSVDFILIEHVWEHISGPDALRCLDECYRILKPGGVLRLCVPIITSKLAKEHARDLILGHGHLAAYTAELVRHFLWLAGFERCYDTSRNEVDGHWRVIGIEKDDLETFRVEAIK